MGYPIRVRACALIIENEKVLLIEFRENGRVHYNLPAGGVERGESVVEAVRREAKEEAEADIEVGSIAFVYEYAPHLDVSGLYGASPHGLSLIFDCKLRPGSIPRMPDHPDLNQIGVKWVPLSDLDKIVLYPNIKSHINQYAQNRSRSIEFIEDHKLSVIQGKGW